MSSEPSAGQCRREAAAPRSFISSSLSCYVYAHMHRFRDCVLCVASTDLEDVAAGVPTGSVFQESLVICVPHGSWSDLKAPCATHMVNSLPLASHQQKSCGSLVKCPIVLMSQHHGGSAPFKGIP